MYLQTPKEIWPLGVISYFNFKGEDRQETVKIGDRSKRQISFGVQPAISIILVYNQAITVICFR